MDKVLVLGATGGIGGEVARQLAAGGWQVIALTRDVEKARRQSGDFIWVQGDAMNRADVLAAASGCSVIVQGSTRPVIAAGPSWCCR